MSNDVSVRNENRERGFCPSCGRYIGAADICPYCGARVHKRIDMKYIKALALIVAIVGTILFVVGTSYISPPSIKISQINQQMNYARVKLSGTVISSSSFNEDSESLSFTISDGTKNELFDIDSIRVTVYSPTSKELVQMGKLPVSGDSVEIVGQIKIRETPYIIVSYSDDVIIHRDTPQEVNFDQIINSWQDYLGSAVIIDGWISEYVDYGDYAICSLRDYNYPDNDLSLYIPQPAKTLTGALANFFVGDLVRVIGNLWEYNNQPEIVPWNASSILIIEKLQLWTLSEVMSNQELYTSQRRIVKLNLTLVEPPYYSSSGAGVSLNVSDSSVGLTKYLKVWIWTRVWDDIPDDIKENITLGRTLLVVGELQEYAGTLELIIDAANWILGVY